MKTRKPPSYLTKIHARIPIFHGETNMTCTEGPSSLLPIANASLLINETIPSAFAWGYYLYDSSLETSSLFDDSATLEATRHSLQTCREWDNICQDSSQIFKNQTNLGVCSVYPNLITDVNDLGRTAALRAVKSIIPTCLISYCALQPSCSSSPPICTISSLFNADGDLSRQGVGRCWYHICMNYYPSVNTDIAGVGVGRPDDHFNNYLLTALVDHLLLDADIDSSIGPYSSRNWPSARYPRFEETASSW